MSSTRVSALLRAPRAVVYRAVTDPAMIRRWRFPGGMTSVVEPQEDGGLLLAVHGGVPDGVDPGDNELGWRMALDRLAAPLEGRSTPA
jgi:hypothetical protein